MCNIDDLVREEKICPRCARYMEALLRSRLEIFQEARLTVNPSDALDEFLFDSIFEFMDLTIYGLMPSIKRR